MDLCKLWKILYSYSGETFLKGKIFQGEKVKEGQTKYAKHAPYLQNILPSRALPNPEASACSAILKKERRVLLALANGGARLRPCPAHSTPQLSALTFTLKNIRHPGPSDKTQGKHHCKKLSFLKAIFAFPEIGSVLPQSGGLGGGAVTEPHTKVLPNDGWCSSPPDSLLHSWKSVFSKDDLFCKPSSVMCTRKRFAKGQVPWRISHWLQINRWLKVKVKYGPLLMF